MKKSLELEAQSDIATLMRYNISMIGSRKIGVGLLTCNRQEKFNRLLKQVVANPVVDQIVVVKNREFDYSKSFEGLFPDRVYSINIKEDVGVGRCKNAALKTLIETFKCDELFLIEDDVLIKDDNVFYEYILTARVFKYGHLNFCRSWDGINGGFLKPFTGIKVSETHGLELFRRLCGNFQYFSREAIEKVGYIDDVHYINVLEHAEHTYRMSLADQTSPFNAFADVHDSDRFLADTGIETSITRDNTYNKRTIDAFTHFHQHYGFEMRSILNPSVGELQKYFDQHLRS